MEMRRFSSLDRQNVLHEMTAMEFDVLIIGGGITGSGIVLDALNKRNENCVGRDAGFCSGVPLAVPLN